MENLVGLPAHFEREKSVYEQLEKSKAGPVLFKVVSRHNGRVTYQVGHIAVTPASEHPLSGVVTEAHEHFVADMMHDNETDGRQHYVKLRLEAERAATEGPVADVPTTERARQ